MNNIEDALKKFLEENPDLPCGPAEDIPQKPKTTKQRLSVTIERKGRAGKVATIISGFTLQPDEVADIASRLKQRLGVGGSARGGEILIQGDRSREVKELLHEMDLM